MKINAKRLRQEGLALLCTLIVGFVGFYIFLPPISLQSQQFYLFAGALCAVWTVLRLPAAASERQGKGARASLTLYALFPMLIAAVLGCLFLLFSLASLTVFNASRYSTLLQVEQGDFAQDIPQITYEQIPMLDTQSAQRLGDRKMGELAAANNEEQKSLVSQFEIGRAHV